MASFSTVLENQAQGLQNSPLIYVHCVSKDNFEVRLANLLCLNIICREIHLSFIDNLVERRVALLPKNNARVDVDDAFQNIDCPALLSVKSSCDIKFLDIHDFRGEVYDGTLISNYEVIPAPLAVCVKAKKTQPTTNVIDQMLPLLNLQAPCNCNCFSSTATKCLVDFHTHREEIEAVLPDSEENEGSATEFPEEEQPEDDDDDEDDEDELYVHCFKIVGSHWEDRYQEALNKCYDLKLKNNEVMLRAKPEPDNIKDCNAIKFEVLHNGNWHIMGYCGVKKIPKLKRALHYKKIVSLTIHNMIRKWVPQTREFRFTAGIKIVKKGRWDKDDLHNEYNSPIAL